MREAVGSALLSSHLESHEYECAIDRIGALSRATSLGSALWRWGYAGDTQALGSALKHLLRKAQRKLKVYKGHRDFETLLNTCKLVLYEWKFRNCMGCGGGGEIESDFDSTGKGTQVKCSVCSGTGTKRYSNEERMEALKLSDFNEFKRAENMISQVWVCLAGADGGTGAVVRDQLEHHI